MNFIAFKQAVATQFAKMSKGKLFHVTLDKNDLWDAYLNAFPPGSNLLFRERTEHDCSCCKQFIRAVGGVVAINGDRVDTIWDVHMPDEPEYQLVANTLAALVRSRPIQNVFLHDSKTAGTDHNFDELMVGKRWDHFFVNIPIQFVVPRHTIGTRLGDVRAMFDVSLRGLNEITLDAIDTVLELISQGSLYRGEEHAGAVKAFRTAKTGFDAALDKVLYVWANLGENAARIRNTVIGTLLVDLSTGVLLEDAVKSFEAKVAPQNYKRPTALVTESMVKKAKETVESLGLTSALQRRHATIRDITINNILFADRGARTAMGDPSPFDDLTPKSKPKNLDKVEEVGIEKFLAEILPKAESIDVMFENRHSGNLVSLIAPQDATAGRLFKWGNNFSWSYSGEVADSIKERVKAAGGNVTGDVCCRLAWDYTDDLDFHMIEPAYSHIYFSNRRHRSRCGGMLDVDANGIDGVRTDPVENIFYGHMRDMEEGDYALYVHNYSRRSGGVGFTVEIDVLGEITTLHYPKTIRMGERVDVATLRYSRAKGVEVIPLLESTTASKTMWGIATQAFHRVGVVMNSPNHWDGEGVGNKHYFFIVDGCKVENPPRPFFNEFLKEELTPHRKVFEVVGSKLRVPDSDEQLSGIGFSSTQRNDLLCRVNGSFSRIVKITF